MSPEELGLPYLTKKERAGIQTDLNRKPAWVPPNAMQVGKGVWKAPDGQLFCALDVLGSTMELTFYAARLKEIARRCNLRSKSDTEFFVAWSEFLSAPHNWEKFYENMFGEELP